MCSATVVSCANCTAATTTSTQNDNRLKAHQHIFPSSKQVSFGLQNNASFNSTANLLRILFDQVSIFAYPARWKQLKFNWSHLRLLKSLQVPQKLSCLKLNSEHGRSLRIPSGVIFPSAGLRRHWNTAAPFCFIAPEWIGGSQINFTIPAKIQICLASRVSRRFQSWFVVYKAVNITWRWITLFPITIHLSVWTAFVGPQSWPLTHLRTRRTLPSLLLRVVAGWSEAGWCLEIGSEEQVLRSQDRHSSLSRWCGDTEKTSEPRRTFNDRLTQVRTSLYYFVFRFFYLDSAKRQNNQKIQWRLSTCRLPCTDISCRTTGVAPSWAQVHQVWEAFWSRESLRTVSGLSASFGCYLIQHTMACNQRVQK